MDIKGFLLLVVVFLGLWGVSSVFKLKVGVLGLFIILGIAILLRFLGGRWLSIFMPRRRLRCWALGMVGGFLASLAFRALNSGPEVLGVNLIGAPLGAALSIFLWGLYPYLVILLRKPLR